MIRPAVKAAIRRAMGRAQRSLERLDGDTAEALRALYAGAVADILQQLERYADDRGNLRAQTLATVLRLAADRLAELAGGQEDLLAERLLMAAQLGAEAFAPDAVAVGASLLRIAEDAVRAVRVQVLEDGLQLSDRLWRVDRGARQALGEQVEAVVLQGLSASRAARELLEQGLPVPAALIEKADSATLPRIRRGLGQALLRDEAGAYANALRVFRTEINRAHGTAFRGAMAAHPDVIGERFMLSPAHPRPDICDLHAHANLYGLGPGVYPVGRSPWPAHPNTLSYLELVFADEVSEADRAGKESRIGFLEGVGAERRAAILGRSKAAALDKGVLREGQIGTPWRVLKRRYERQGIAV